jgi:hypothetical protein
MIGSDFGPIAIKKIRFFGQTVTVLYGSLSQQRDTVMKSPVYITI